MTCDLILELVLGTNLISLPLTDHAIMDGAIGSKVSKDIAVGVCPILGCAFIIT